MDNGNIAVQFSHLQLESNVNELVIVELFEKKYSFILCPQAASTLHNQNQF